MGQNLIERIESTLIVSVVLCRALSRISQRELRVPDLDEVALLDPLVENLTKRIEG